ncbi:MAG: hypothetical protein O3C40_09225 [Planctomycetota bacterium]|nr:hypothetical protein [Planctomycetota bacterium]
MSRNCKRENLASVKNSLADKYIRLARAQKSKPRQAKLYRRAEGYRHQAAILARSLGV